MSQTESGVLFQREEEVPIPPQLRFFLWFSFKKSHLNISLSEPEGGVLFQREEGSAHSATLRFLIRFPFKKSHLKEKVLDISLSQPECEVPFYSATTQICDKVSL